MRRTRIVTWAVTALAGMMLAGAGAGAAFADQSEPASPPVRGAMLLLDTSGSMTKEGLRAARRAAVRYAEAVPEDVRVGLITFGTEPGVGITPTTDRTMLTEGLTSMDFNSDGTYLYDAIQLAVSALGELGSAAERRLVVLSDGEDTTSRITLEAARRAVVGENVVADFVAYRYGDADASAINQLAKASGGRVLRAEDADQLAKAFADIARTPPAAVKSGEEGPAWLAWLPTWSWNIFALAALSFLALLLLVLAIAYALVPREDSGQRLLTELARYGPRRVPQDTQQQGVSSLAQRAVGLTEDMLRARGWEDKLAERLDLADVKMKPAEWTVLRVCIGITLSALLVMAGVFVVIAVPIGGLFAWAGTFLFVRVRISRRRAAFSDQLPDVLQLIAGSLRSGFSLAQALDAVVRDDTQPSAGEFARALAETRIGVELEDGLDRVAYRMASDDLKWVIMAIRIQREVGGNLAEVLLTTVTTMRERAQTRRQVRALSAEGRWSAYVLLALPFVIGGFFMSANPEYMAPLFTRGIGILMIVAAVLLMGFGSFWMSRVIKVEV